MGEYKETRQDIFFGVCVWVGEGIKNRFCIAQTCVSSRAFPLLPVVWSIYLYTPHKQKEGITRIDF